MKMTGIAAVAALGVALSGCASVFEGLHQDINVATTPPGAHCDFFRHGEKIAEVASTPGTANVRKLKYDIMIKCHKDGYEEADYNNHSGVSAAIAGNVAADLILTAGLSSVVDSADGADNKYDTVVNITMVPAQATYSMPSNMKPYASGKPTS
jgi:uncharacterized protein YceK